jgi:hypothetical protein
LKRFMLSAALALMVATGPARASNDPVINGVGTTTCAEFADSYRLSPAVTDATYGSWLWGFLSGFNAMVSYMGKPSRDIKTFGVRNIERRVREYCDAHPLGEYVDAVVFVLNQLPPMKDEK